MRELRYFKPREFECEAHCGDCLGLMDETLLVMLDELRHKVGRPLRVNSGFRCEAKNARTAGAVKGSSHCKGLAVDLACTDSELRFRLVQEAMALGFKRIGVAETFVHLDIDPDKPQGLLFLY